MITSGSSAIGPVVISPAIPVARPEPSAPVTTATTRSRTPRAFHTTKVLLAAKLGLRMRATINQGAVTPIAMSPSPAGNAKMPGNTPWAYNARNSSVPLQARST